MLQGFRTKISAEFMTQLHNYGAEKEQRNKLAKSRICFSTCLEVTYEPSTVDLKIRMYVWSVHQQIQYEYE
jgi:hypothetical protein